MFFLPLGRLKSLGKSGSVLYSTWKASVPFTERWHVEGTDSLLSDTGSLQGGCDWDLQELLGDSEGTGAQDGRVQSRGKRLIRKGRDCGYRGRSGNELRQLEPRWGLLSFRVGEE